MSLSTHLSAMREHVHVAPVMDVVASMQLGNLSLSLDATLVTVIAGAWLLVTLGMAWLVMARRGR